MDPLGVPKAAPRPHASWKNPRPLLTRIPGSAPGSCLIITYIFRRLESNSSKHIRYYNYNL